MQNKKEIERSILWAIMSRKFVINEIRELLTPECFYDEFHSNIYKSIISLCDKGDTADQMSVVEEMNKLGYPCTYYDIAELITDIPIDPYQYASYLNEANKRRKLAELGMRIACNAEKEENEIDSIISDMGKSLEDILRNSKTSICTIKDAIKGIYNIIVQNRVVGEITGSKTGFKELDNRSGGLQKSDLIIIAGESSQGKTAFAVSMMSNMAKSGKKIAMYSMEMKKEQIVARMLAAESNVSSSQILYSNMDQYKFDSVENSVKKLDSLGIYFDDQSTSSIDNILTSIRTIKLKYDIDGAIVDYLQILNVNMKGSNKEQQMADVARRLKNIAKELDIWIIALSQLNRDSMNQVPTLNRLRDSGQIAEAADIVMLVYRPEYYGENKKFPEPYENTPIKGKAMIDIAKGRNIGIGKFICGFRENSTTFFDEEVDIPNYHKVETESPF